jgi:ribonuclease HI
MQKKYIRIITDGSCKGNPGVGGWAFLLQFLSGKKIITQKEKSGCSKKTTNNIMELTALINALKELKPNAKKYYIEIHTDSMYLVNGVEKWRDSWEYRNYRGVKNAELWKELFSLIDKFNKYSNIKMNYVKAHTNNSNNSEIEKLNNYVDSLAQNTAKSCF